MVWMVQIADGVHSFQIQADTFHDFFDKFFKMYSYYICFRIFSQQENLLSLHFSCCDGCEFSKLKIPYNTVTAVDFGDLECEASAKSRRKRNRNDPHTRPADHFPAVLSFRLFSAVVKFHSRRSWIPVGYLVCLGGLPSGCRSLPPR